MDALGQATHGRQFFGFIRGSAHILQSKFFLRAELKMYATVCLML